MAARQQIEKVLKMDWTTCSVSDICPMKRRWMKAHYCKNPSKSHLVLSGMCVCIYKVSLC